MGILLLSAGFSLYSDGNVESACIGANDTTHAMFVVSWIREKWDWPDTVPAWTRRVLAPWPFDVSSLNLPQYYRSFSAYAYYDSYGQYVIAGEINPGFGNRVILVDSEEVFSGGYNASRFQREILHILDSLVNFNDYDLDGDCVVDNGAIIFPTPLFYVGHPHLLTSYTTNDSCGSGFVEIYETSGITLGYGRRFPYRYQAHYYMASPIIFHEWLHILCAPDKYDNGRDNSDWDNCRVETPYAKSNSVGLYSQMSAILFNMPRPSDPVDKLLMHNAGNYDRVQVVNITSSGTYVIEDHATSGKIYRIMVSPSEQFIITNHQKLNRVEDFFPGKGILIWHYDGTPPPILNYSFETDKHEDLESAFGLWDYRGMSYGEDPVTGSDNLDFGIDTSDLPSCWSYYLRNTIGVPAHGYMSPYDFFNESTKQNFDHLSNPSSDAYNFIDRFEVTYPSDSCFENSGVWVPGLCITDTIIRVDPENPFIRDTVYAGWLWWRAYSETAVPQNIATHIAIRNIRKEGAGPNMLIDVLLNYVQSDDSIASGPAGAKRVVVSPSGVIHMVYHSRGYVYYTYAPSSSVRWAPAFPVDKGKYPTIAYSSLGNTACISWIGGDALKFNCGNSLYDSWRDGHAVLLDGTETLKKLYAPAMVIGRGDTVHVVVKAENHVGPLRYFQILYGKFPRENPSDISWREVGKCQYYSGTFSRSLPSYDPEEGPTLTLWNSTYPFVAWSCHDTLFYAYNNGTAWYTNVRLNAGYSPHADAMEDTVFLAYLNGRQTEIRHFHVPTSRWSYSTVLDDSAFVPMVSYPFVGWIRVKSDHWCDICREIRLSYRTSGGWSSPVTFREASGYMDYLQILPVPVMGGTRLHVIATRYDGRGYELAHDDTTFTGVYTPLTLVANEKEENGRVRLELLSRSLIIHGNVKHLSVTMYGADGRKELPNIHRKKNITTVSFQNVPRGVYILVIEWPGGKRILKTIVR
ncbi:MAG: hypothetical protein GXO39_03910 [Thermotogae bacterium]|nr:hypothetical protein [Thermotogota bacterium]